MKKITLKTLLVSAVLCMESMSAWADDEYSAVYTKTLTGETAWVSSDLTDWGVADNNNFSVGETNGLSLTVNGYSYSASYTVSSIATTSKIKYVVEWFVGYLVANNSNNTTNNTYLIFGDKLRLSFDRGYNVYWSTDGTFIRDADHKVSENNARDKTITVTLIYDPIKRTIESFTTSGINSYANDLTSALNKALIKEDIDMRKVTFGYYRTGNNNEITTSIKSIAVSECTQEVPSGHRYTINAVDGSGNIIRSLKSDYATNGEAVSVSNLNLVLYKSGKYYELNDASVTSYAKSFTMVDDEITFNVTYKEASDIVYFNEAESITGSAGATANSGASGGAYTSYFSSSKTTGVKTLDQGVYRAETYIWGRTNQHINLYNTSKDNANILAQLTGSGSQSREFIIDTDNTATVLSCTNNSCCFDYLLIRKIASVSKTITSAGWATYCSPYALDFSSSIANLTNAYLITGVEADGTTLTLSEISGTIPANTGVLLEGEGTCAIPVAASSSTDVSANKLVGVTAATPIAASAGYVLMDETNGVGFYLNNNAFTVGANTAYLPENFAGAKIRFFGFGDNASGIKSIEANAYENGAIYNLGGQRVNAAYKGIVFKNGKKYLVR